MQEGLSCKWVTSIWEDLPAASTYEIFSNIRNLCRGVFLLCFKIKKPLQIPSQTSRKMAGCVLLGKWKPLQTPHFPANALSWPREFPPPGTDFITCLNFLLRRLLCDVETSGDSWVVLAKFLVVHKCGAVRNKAPPGLWGVSNPSQAKAEWDQGK